MDIMRKALGPLDFRNLRIVKSGEYRNLIKSYEFITKDLTKFYSRPPMDEPYTTTDTGAKLPIFPFPRTMIQALADNVDALRIPIDVLVREVFKNGFDVIPKFQYKCKNKQCLKEFKVMPVNPKRKPQEMQNSMQQQSNQEVEKKPEVKKQEGQNLESPNIEASGVGAGASDEENDLLCDVCGGTEFDKPAPAGRQKLVSLITDPQNNNGQHLKEIAMMFERNLDIHDDAYLVALYQYRIDKMTGKIKEKYLKEIMTINPIQCAMIADPDGRIGYDDNRTEVYVCPQPEHRFNRILKGRGAEQAGVRPRCPECGSEALRAWMEVNSVYSVGIPNPKKVLYAEGEILFKPGKFKPGLLYGFSPIYSIWSKVMALSHMDEYIRKYFDKMRPPRGLLVVGSKNYNTLQKAWDMLETKAREDPFRLFPLMVETEKGGRNMVQYVDLTGSLADLQFIEIRDEFRRTIGAIYGVLPLFSGDLPTGWSQEGLQFAVTNRMVTWSQDVLYESLFEPLCRLYGVDDWVVKLKQGEQTDKLRDLQIRGQEIANAAQMDAMGFAPTLDANNEFVFPRKPSKPMVQDGGFGTPKDRGSKPKDEQSTSATGEPASNRPSDPGGTSQGSMASGPKTSMQKKGKGSKIRKTKYIVKKPKNDEQEVEKVEEYDD